MFKCVKRLKNNHRLLLQTLDNALNRLRVVRFNCETIYEGDLTVIIMFQNGPARDRLSWKNQSVNFLEPTLSDTIIFHMYLMSGQSYLRVITDQQLSWKPHMDYVYEAKQ